VPALVRFATEATRPGSQHAVAAWQSLVSPAALN